MARGINIQQVDKDLPDGMLTHISTQELLFCESFLQSKSIRRYFPGSLVMPDRKP